MIQITVARSECGEQPASAMLVRISCKPTSEAAQMPAAVCGPKAEDRKRSRCLAPGRLLIWDRTETAGAPKTA
jgi:hypothetical protein